MPSVPNCVEADRALLTAVAHKERDALAAFYERFQRPLFGYLFRMTDNQGAAEDVLQEVMIVVWQKAHTFNGTGTVASWIFGIAHNLALKSFCHDHGVASTLLQLDYATDIIDDALTPEAGVLRLATAEAVVAGLARLTPEHREVLELAFFQDFSCKEIAVITKIPEGTVKSRLSYARRALKATLLRMGWEAT